MEGTRGHAPAIRNVFPSLKWNIIARTVLVGTRDHFGEDVLKAILHQKEKTASHVKNSLRGKFIDYGSRFILILAIHTCKVH